jgi:hypothetical protein
VPPIDTGRENTSAGRRRPARKRKDHLGGVRAGADTTGATAPRGVPTRPKPSGPSGAFGGARSTRPLERQQRQARNQTERAARRTPRPVIAAPPVIANPTPRQTRAAKAQIVASLNRQLGDSRGAERNRQRETILHRIRTDPGMARTRASLEHWSQADQALITPYARARLGRDRVKPGPEPKRVGIGPASINLTATGLAIANAAERAAPGLASGSAEARFGANAFKDVGTLATAPFVAGAGIAGIGMDLAKGDVGKAAGKVEQFGRGVVEGTYRDWSHPQTYLREHPLLFGLDVAGATAVAGRAAGAVARGAGSTAASSGVRGALARTGSTVRSPLALTDEVHGPVVERSFSKDLTRKAAQSARDTFREPLRDAEGKVVTRSDRGREVPVLKATEGERRRELKKEGDFQSSRANNVERMVRDAAEHEMRVKGLRGRRAKDLVSMVVEGTITSARHFDEDLRSERDRIAGYLAEHDRTGDVYRHGGDLKAAQAKVKWIDETLAHPKVREQRAAIVQAGEDIGRRLNETEREAIEQGLLHGKRAKRARLIVPAVAHMGGRYFHEPELQALERAGVTVRHPAKLREYEDAQAGHTAAQTEHAAAVDRVKKLEAKRQRLIGAQASRRGSRGVGSAPTRAERAKLGKVTADLKIARDEARAAGKKAAKAKRVAEKTPKPPLREALRHGDGKFLANDEIENFLRDRGRDPDTVAYLPHRASSRGSFHKQMRPGARGTMDNAETRTGSMYAKGVTRTSTDLIREQGVRQVVQINKARALDKMVTDMGVKHPEGRYFTAKEALETAARLEEDTGQRLVPVSAFPAKLDAETRRIIREDLQGPGAMGSLGERLLNERIVKGKGAENVVLVPGEYVDRLLKHMRPAGEIAKFFQALNKPFRFAVLGLGLDIAAASRAIRHLEGSKDPRTRRAAEEVRGQQLGGLGIGGRTLSVHRSADELATTGRVVAGLPVIGQGFDILRRLGHLLMVPGNAFFKANRVIENVAQRAALGRDVRRDMQALTGSWTKTITLQKKALEDAAKGLIETPAQRRFMRSQHETLGKYEGFSPTMRGLVQTVFPFLPWMLNAARFTLWTMPAHHTALTALLTRVNDVMSKDWQEIHSKVPPGSLKYAIPTKNGGWLDLARYTPYGLTAPIVGSEGKNWQAVTGQVVPVAQGSVNAFTEGEDPFGRKLKLDPTENPGQEEPGIGQRAGVALYGLAEALTPYLRQARVIRERGGTAYAGSTVVDPDVKPNTNWTGGVDRAFNPLHATHLGPKPSSSSSGPVPSQASSATSRGLPASVQRALAADARSRAATELPASVQRALARLAP